MSVGGSATKGAGDPKDQGGTNGEEGGTHQAVEQQGDMQILARVLLPLAQSTQQEAAKRCPFLGN